MNRLYGKTYIAVYQTAGEKTRRALAKWHDDLVILGVRGECKGMPQMVLDAIVEEAANIGRTQEARSTAGRKGNAVRWSQEPSQNVSQTASQTASQNVSQTHRTGTGTSKVERDIQPCARAREGNPAETPEEEARRLGYGQFAGAAAELRRLVPAGIPLAAVYEAADAKGFGAEELLQFANHYAGYNWRRGQGQGIAITGDTIGNVLAVWAARRGNYAAAGRTGAARQDADGGAAAEAAGKPKGKGPKVWRFDEGAFKEDRGAFVWGLPDEALPYFALWLCREENNRAAAGRYRKCIEKHGAAAFRRELDKFAGALAAGEEPENRGSAFMAAVKKMEEA